MGKGFSKDVHPDRSGSMRNRPGVENPKGKSSFSIRDTAEGEAVLERDSKGPNSKTKDTDE